MDEKSMHVTSFTPCTTNRLLYTPVDKMRENIQSVGKDQHTWDKRFPRRFTNIARTSGDPLEDVS